MHITDPSTRELLAEIDATLKLGRERHLDFRERAFNLLKRLRPLVEREDGQMRPEQHAISHDATAAVDAPSGPETSEPGSAERPGRASANAVHPPDPHADARALIERSKLSQDGSLFNWFERCDWCGWTLAESVAKGCVVDNCSQRPMPGLGDWGRQRRLLRDLIAALEAALEREAEREASGAQALAALRKVHRNSDCNCGGGYVCDELRAIDALEEAITRKALE